MDKWKNVLDMFFENVCASPQLVALELNEQIWTYSELLTNVLRVTHHLEIELGEIVFQYVDRSLEMVCGLLGIMCVGGVYCALNPANPPTYIRTLLDNLPARFVLVHSRTRDKFPSTSSQLMQLVNLEQIFSMDIMTDAIEKEIYLNSESLSIINCTSGTTGRPKAILHTHGSLVAGLQAVLNVNIQHGDKVLQVAASSWIVHVVEILLSFIATSPGTLVLLRPDDNLNMTRFCKTIKDKQVTFFLISASMLKMLLDYLELNSNKPSDILKQLRIFWTSGEVCTPQDVVKLKSFALQTRILLTYGMGETFSSIGSYVEQGIDELSNLKVLPLGYSLAGYRCLLIDEANGQIIPSSCPNKVGQIHVAGVGLFQCYYNNPELSNKVRVKIDNELFFTTGDLAKYNVRGELVYVGRIDFQLKIRGQRIEPDEIESALMEIVANCLVTKVTHLGDDHLVAYVQTTHEQHYLRQHCLSRLPLHMIPSLFIIVDKFPINQNGKMDRSALPPADFSLASTATISDEQPRTDMEKEVHSIWCQVFSHFSSISITRTLFELGGTSISVVKLSNLYETTLNRNVNIGDLLRQPTISHHARLLEQTAAFEDD